MPANLTADYLAADEAYKRAQTQAERVAALEQMLAALPKHKGTEKLHADLKRKLSEARRHAPKKAAAHAVPVWLVRHEGAGQVALVGPPNSGKSQLLRAVTRAEPEVADYPFTTRLPMPGMMRFENVAIQLVDMPPLSPEFMEPWMSNAIRGADSSVLVVDPGDPEVLGQLEFIFRTLGRWSVPAPKLLVGNKIDRPGADENFSVLQALSAIPSVAVSSVTAAGLHDFARGVFLGLDVVRFYSKAPGKRPDFEKPYVLRRGSTVQDAAAHVHRDFAEHLKFAKRFDKSDEHHGLMVERTHAVEDEDVLEFHASG